MRHGLVLLHTSHCARIEMTRLRDGRVRVEERGGGEHRARESGPSACGGVRAARGARLGIVRGASVERGPITFLGTRRNVEERA